MNGTTRSRLLLAALFASLLSVAAPRCHADQWTAPTQEELSMTSQPQVPGAAAVYLYREQTTDDHLHSFSIYVRLKVLTEKGKEYSNVELDYASRQGGGGYTIENVVGRTIHPDGTIIPFTGKPYDKLIEKTQGVKYMAKVFTMPDVQVGSIIEYRYALRYDDHYFIAPKWFVQSKLYTRRSHYGWRPTSKSLVSSDERGQLTSAIAWFPVLPAGSELKNTRLPPIGGNEGQLVFELNMHDIPPAPDEEYMPPISSLSYRVLFYYTPYHDPADFWKNEGKYWGKQSDKFMNPGSRVKAAVQELTTPADTQDQKLRKLYAAVMKLENTDFTREHSSSEEKAQGLKEIRTADDIWDRKRGSSDQLSELFVSMARAAGMKSYLMAVTNRDRNIFLEGYLSLSQLDDYIAIVNIDGKEQYFDPGSRYCPYQHLEWKHTFANGIRQTENGSALGATPGDPYTNQRISRVANLTMDQQGRVSGSVDMIYIGAPALAWRHSSLRGDRTGLERELRVSLEELLPNGDGRKGSLDRCSRRL